jgi:hypothetical protein
MLYSTINFLKLCMSILNKEIFLVSFLCHSSAVCMETKYTSSLLNTVYDYQSSSNSVECTTSRNYASVEHSTSAIYGWISVYSHLMCQITEQLRQELPEVATNEHRNMLEYQLKNITWCMVSVVLNSGLMKLNNSV